MDYRRTPEYTENLEKIITIKDQTIDAQDKTITALKRQLELKDHIIHAYDLEKASHEQAN